MALRRIPRWLIALGTLVAIVLLVVVFWRWDWFIPLVEARASAALGRPVTIAHLHVQLGRVTRLIADDVEVANPKEFPPDSRFAKLDHLAVDLDVAGLLHDRSTIRIPRIGVQHPVVEVATGPSGEPNWKLATGSGSSSGGPSVKIGDLVIEDGHAHVDIPKLKSNFELAIATREPGAQSSETAPAPVKEAPAEGKSGEAPAQGEPGQAEPGAAEPGAAEPGAAQIVVDAHGTYADQPISGRFIGGALLSLRDAAHPYPIDLHAANGQTKVAITGTVEDPLAFKGAKIKLDLAGPDMEQLYHLTGIPIPQTPPYELSGNLDYAAGKYHFTNFAGRLGHSDLEGSIAVDPGADRPMVTADLASRRVDLTDLGGFIGTTPGRAGKGQTPEQRREKAREEKSPNLLPDQPLNLPKLQAADVDLRYRGAKIEGRSIPFDTLAVDATIRNGAVRLHPISLGVGKGKITGTVDLDPTGKALALKADVEFRQVDVARIMSATHAFGGAGTIGGRAVVSGTGDSLAQILGRGNGDLKLFMTGGDLSALLVDLAGLDFGNSLLSALGVPKRAEVRCMVVHMPLEQGVLNTQILLIDTTEANIIGSGTVNLRNETVDYQVKTDPKHFSIGSIPAPIDIRGPLKSPSILPDPKELATRGGIAAALGVVLTPLAALIPTIQLGLGEDTDCSRTIASVGEQGKENHLSPAGVHRRTGHRPASRSQSRQ